MPYLIDKRGVLTDGLFRRATKLPNALLRNKNYTKSKPCSAKCRSNAKAEAMPR